MAGGDFPRPGPTKGKESPLAPLQVPQRLREGLIVEDPIDFLERVAGDLPSSGQAHRVLFENVAMSEYGS